jgi:hypothetical protein
MKNNPFKDRDLTKQLLFTTISWSSMNAFESYDKEDWYKQYVLGERGDINPAMLAGIVIGERLATDPKYLPEVPRPQIYEYNVSDKFSKINITGHMDGWSYAKKELLEYKTTSSETRWTQKKVDDWGQLTFYCLLLYLKHDVRPETLKIKLVSIPVKMGGDFDVSRSKAPIKIFETNRTMIDILNFMVRIKQVHKEMREYVDNYPRQ